MLKLKMSIVEISDLRNITILTCLDHLLKICKKSCSFIILNVETMTMLPLFRFVLKPDFNQVARIRKFYSSTTCMKTVSIFLNAKIYNRKKSRSKNEKKKAFNLESNNVLS